MKLCPQCTRTYSDDSLRFCLDDGSVLVRDEPVTLPYRRLPEEVSQETILRQRQAIAPSPTTPNPVVTTSSSSPVLTAGVIAIALLLLVLVVVGVAFIYKFGKGSEKPVQATSSPTPVPPRESGNADQERPTPVSPLQMKASASSTRYAVQANTYDPANVLDNNKKTAWIEGVDGSGIGEWLRFDFGREIKLHRIVILPGYFKSQEIWAQNNRLAAATLQFSDGSSQRFTFPDRMERRLLDVGSVKTRWVRLVIDDVFAGTDPDTAVSEIAFEWEP